MRADPTSRLARSQDNWIYAWDLARRFEELPDRSKKDALLILGRAKGRGAVEKCVAALQSTDESVASVAVDQLIDPTRERMGHLAHCFFSPSLNAIQRSIERVNSPRSAHMAIFGLVHPELRESILQKLSSVRIEIYSLPTIRIFEQSGIIDQQTALALVKQCGLENLVTHIACNDSIDASMAANRLREVLEHGNPNRLS